ncbi:MAG: hypothetical protein ACXVJT_01735 [Thermoanaerobaculia bacterium]
MKRLAFACCFLTALAIHAAGGLAGAWELIDATPVTLQNSDPHGIVNHKLYFTADGRMFIIAPEEKLDTNDTPVQYVFDGSVRTLTLPGGEVHRSSVKLSGNTMKVTTEDGVTFTYRRLTGDRAYDRTIEPRSVEILETEDHAQSKQPRYDTTDYSKVAMPQRIRGVWEIVRYRNVKFEAPLYGFPNDKYVITSREVAMVAPSATKVDGDSRGKYHLEGTTMVVDDGSRWGLAFNQWQQLVLTRDDAEITMRLVTKDTRTIPALPVKIVLYEE